MPSPSQLMNILAGDEQDQTESWTPEKKATRTEQTKEEKAIWLEE